MNSNRAKIIVLAVFVLTLGAGVTAGILAAKLPRAGDSTVGQQAASDSSLTAELNLTGDQGEQMQKIWEGVRDLSSDSLSKAVSAQQARDDAIRALIPPDKIDDFNKIQRNYSESIAKMKGTRQSAFDRAVAASNKILTEPQRRKYAEILEKRLGAENVTGHDPLENSAGIISASQPSP